MSDISYKKFSDLAAANTLIAADIIPVVTTTGGNNSKKITYETFAQTVSSTLIGPFTTTITAVEPASAGRWNSTYTTVNTNSASWGTGSSTGGLTIFKQISSIASPNNTTTVHALSIDSSVTNVDIAILSKGVGSTLAQIPDDQVTGGIKRGQYATDFQKLRDNASEVASGNYSTIGGGFGNRSSANYTTVAGGNSNNATALNATVGGGTGNEATALNATVGGGAGNYAASSSATIAGGGGNEANGGASFIGGGSLNTASGSYSTVGCGLENTASGNYSSVVGGSYNNTNGKSNTHIIGSNITASLSDYTYVNNISSQGTVVSNTTTSTTISAATYQGIQAIKAWVNFDGTGSVGSNATLNASYNIDFVRKTNIGLYTVVFSSPSIFANANYIMSGTASGNLLLTPVLSADSRTAAPSLKTSLSCMVAILTGSATTTNRADSKQIGLMFIGS
jgi:hypothetical protein